MITEFSKAVCVTEADILSKRGVQRICDIRQTYWLLLFNNGFSCTQIARLNDRKHGTIISGIRRIKGLLDAKDETITRLYNLTKNIKR